MTNYCSGSGAKAHDLGRGRTDCPDCFKTPTLTKAGTVRAHRAGRRRDTSPARSIEAGHVLTFDGQTYLVVCSAEVDAYTGSFHHGFTEDDVELVVFWAGRPEDVRDEETGMWHDDPPADKFVFPADYGLHFG